MCRLRPGPLGFGGSSAMNFVWENSVGGIRGTREPEPGPGPLFPLIRGKASCAWAVREDIPQELAAELDGFARQEPPVSDFWTLLFMPNSTCR